MFGQGYSLTKTVDSFLFFCFVSAFVFSFKFFYSCFCRLAVSRWAAVSGKKMGVGDVYLEEQCRQSRQGICRLGIPVPDCAYRTLYTA